MKIPKHIVSKADKIIANSLKNRKLESEIIAWINSKGQDVGESDVMAMLMYAEYQCGQEFAKYLKEAMESGRLETY